MDKMTALNKQLEKLTADTMRLRATTLRGKSDGSYPSPEYLAGMRPTSEALDQCLWQITTELEKNEPLKVTRENVWLWGGPTPYWGGSLEPDTAMKGAEFFGLENVVYVYGALDETSLDLHRKCRKLLCQLTHISRSPGAQTESNIENATRLSQLAQKYPNIKGGIIDDLIGNYGYSMTRAEVARIHGALKTHDEKLKLYAVVYVHELEKEAVRVLAPYIDCVNLWVWRKTELPGLDLAVEKCRALFPGKEIMMGIFMHDYGMTNLGMPSELLRFHLRQAKKYLAAGKINDIVILGDREIAKWPTAATTVKEFLQAEFAG